MSELVTRVFIDRRGIVEEDKAPGVVVDLSYVGTVQADNVLLCTHKPEALPSGVDTVLCLDEQGTLTLNGEKLDSNCEDVEMLFAKNEELILEVKRLREANKKLTGRKLAAEAKLARLIKASAEQDDG